MTTTQQNQKFGIQHPAVKRVQLYHMGIGRTFVLIQNILKHIGIRYSKFTNRNVRQYHTNTIQTLTFDGGMLNTKSIPQPIPITEYTKTIVSHYSERFA